ncbi:MULTISPECIES: hypothetical protein [Lysobacter]|uniref:hypothetical protein n=1 Tax=Lysobacter TaxID=68 RepID=UPI0004D006DD|nr:MULTISPECIES: hypothetical protein [Lysobacter]
MHTVMVILGGLVLLALCLLAARLLGGPGPGPLLTALKLFLPLWFIGAAINLWIGVARAGYSVAEELPIFLAVFGGPAAVALLLWWRLSRG